MYARIFQYFLYDRLHVLQSMIIHHSPHKQYKFSFINGDYFILDFQYTSNILLVYFILNCLSQIIDKFVER